MKRAITVTVLGLLALMAGAHWIGQIKAEEKCPPAAGLNYVCGPVAVEDLVRVPGTLWIIGSGMAENKTPGKLHLIDAGKKSWEILYPSSGARNELDAKSYPACPGAPDANNFGAHGIAIRDDGNRTSTLLAVNHGREAIEVFRFNAAGENPAIRWIGCVPMDGTIYVNSVAFLPQGGFVFTKFYDPKAPQGFRAIMERKTTGGVFEWHPETGISPIAGTELAGANGIEVSKDGKSLYVAAWGTQELVRFRRFNGSIKKDVLKIDFWPDNLRWAPDGMILVAGQTRDPDSAGGTFAFKGWKVVKLDTKTMEITEVLSDHGDSPLQNASVAIDVGGTLWIGSFRADRVAYKPAP
jgi:hypothetical protein